MVLNSGEVLVEATGAGTYKGTVVKDTQFSTCTHRAGEVMWEMAATADPNVFTGGHNWFNTSTCTFQTPKGRAKWTITSTDPANFTLSFCTVPPSNTTDPPDNDPTGCSELKRIRPPAAAPTFASTVVLPKAGKKCRSRRNFRIRLRQPAADPLQSATVKVNGRTVRTIKRDRITAPVDLRDLPKGRYTVLITATTASGKTIKGSRKYRTCVPKRKR